MRLQIEYHSTSITVDPADIVDHLAEDASDAGILIAIQQTLDTIICEGVWPSYRVIGLEDLTAAVREKHAALNKPEPEPARAKRQRRSKVK